MKLISKVLVFAGMIFSVSLLGCEKKTKGKIIYRNSFGSSSASSSAMSTEKKPVELKISFAHNQTALDNPYVFGAEAFKSKLEQVSGGGIEAVVYNGTLDENESGLVDKMNAGQATIVVVSPSLVPTPEVDMFALNYLFDNFAHWGKCLDGEFGTELAKIVSQKTNNKFKILGYWSAGVRDYYGKVPVRTPSDLDGLTIRIGSSPVQQQFWKSCGAIPKSVGWGALYDALNKGEVDSAENDYTNFMLKKHHVAKNGHYISETEHDFTTRLMLIDGKFYDSLSSEQKSCIDQAAKYATQVERQKTFEQASSSKAKVKADGAEIIESSEVDMDAFKALAYPIQDSYAKNNGMEKFLQMVRDAK